METKQILNILLLLAIIIGWLFWSSKSKKKAKEQAKDKKETICQIFNEYGLAFFEMIMYSCKYIGGHPERDRETSSNENILFGTKNGKLIFFASKFIHFDDFMKEEGRTSHKELDVEENSELTHLFDITIDSIVDIRYFDATTSSVVGGVGTSIGGIGVGIPIRMKQGDASVLIDWNDGKYNHSTEFRFAGLLQGIGANRKANTLRNILIKMTKENTN